MNEKTEFMFSIVGVLSIALFIGYAVTSYFDVTPPAMVDLSNWISENTYVIAFVLCFFAACYVLVIIKKRGGE